jgi:hypothetical protein
LFLDVECERPEHWCGGQGSTYIQKDCDLDGILDPYCELPYTDGIQKGAILSSEDCRDTWYQGNCGNK